MDPTLSGRENRQRAIVAMRKAEMAAAAGTAVGRLAPPAAVAAPGMGRTALSRRPNIRTAGRPVAVPLPLAVPTVANISETPTARLDLVAKCPAGLKAK